MSNRDVLLLTSSSVLTTKSKQSSHAVTPLHSSVVHAKTPTTQDWSFAPLEPAYAVVDCAVCVYRPHFTQMYLCIRAGACAYCCGYQLVDDKFPMNHGDRRGVFGSGTLNIFTLINTLDNSSSECGCGDDSS